MNKIAQFLTSFNAVVLGLLVFVTYRYFEVQALFYRYLPLQEDVRFIASILVAFVVVFSLLVFSANIDRFKLTKYGDGDWIKRVMFLFTLFINAFFWEAWTIGEESSNYGADSGLVIGFKITITLFMAVFDYAYNHLFISLWFEKQERERASLSVVNLLGTESNLKQAISKQQASLKQLIRKQDPKVCPRCGNQFENLNQRNGHLRGCKNKI